MRCYVCYYVFVVNEVLCMYDDLVNDGVMFMFDDFVGNRCVVCDEEMDELYELYEKWVESGDCWDGYDDGED